MPLPALVPLLGSIAGTLAGPGIGAAVASALGLGGTAAGGLIAAAAPKAIGAGIASLAAGASVPDAVQQVMQGQPGMGAGGQPSAPMGGGIFAPQQMTSAPASYAPQQPLQSLAPAMPMGGQPQPQMQPAMGAPQPQLSDILAPQAGVPTPQPFGQQIPNVRQSLNTGLATNRPQARPGMGSITRGIV